MKRQLAIRVQIFRGFAGDESTDVFNGEWLTPNYSEDDSFDMNPTTSVLNIKIDKQVNSPSQTCTLTLSPQRDASGVTWQERIGLFDVVVVTARVATNYSFTEEVIFFGFVQEVTTTQAFTQKVNEYVMVTADTIGHLLLAPFLNFSNYTDPLSSVIGVEHKLYERLSSVKGNAAELMEKILDYFDEFISSIKIHTETGNKDFEDYLGYCVHSSSVVHPFYFTMPKLLGGFANNFWNCFMHVAELWGNVGWMHEIIVDVMPLRRFNKFMEFAEADSTLSGVTSTPIALPVDTMEDHVIAVIMRPYTFPFIEAKSDGVVKQMASGVHSLMDNWDKFSLNSQYYNAIMSDTTGEFVNFIDNGLLNSQATKTARDVKTAFFLSMEIDQTGMLQNSVPSVIDILNYKRRGYDLLTAATKYTSAITSLDDSQATDRLDAITALFKLNLRFASYNSLMDVMKVGGFSTPFDITLKIGNYFNKANLNLERRDIGYITRVTHNINLQGGASTTSIQFSRCMSESDWENIDELFKNRFVICSLMNQREVLEKYPGINYEQVTDYRKGVEQQ